jgi:hypothetical protein
MVAPSKIDPATAVLDRFGHSKSNTYATLSGLSGVPVSTLWHRDHGRLSIQRKGAKQQYLTPQEEKALVNQSYRLPWESAFRRSRWFERGWTLQELIAPKSAEFFSKDYELLGDKKSLERQICEITRIPSNALRGSPLPTFSVAERMSWAETRKTTYEEDMVYSLLGIFDVYMSLIYGEGRNNAGGRLREAIDRKEKGVLSLATRVGYNYSEVTNLGRDQIRGLFGPIQSLYSL